MSQTHLWSCLTSVCLESFFQFKKVSVCCNQRKIWLPTGLIKGCKKDENHNKSSHIDNCAYVKRRVGQFYELLIYRSSSTMFKLRLLVSVQRADVADEIVGYVVFIMTLDIFTVWYFRQLMTNWDFTSCVIHDSSKGISPSYFLVKIDLWGEIIAAGPFSTNTIKI